MHTHTHLHRQRTLAIVFFCGLLFALPAHAQLGLSMTPMRLEIPATPGKSFTGTLLLGNSALDKVRVRAEILDFYVDANQTPQFFPSAPSETDHSCRSWLSLNPMEAEIPGRSNLPIRFTLRVPDNAQERSFHCAIGFVSMPPADEVKGIGVRTAVRVVSVLYPIVGKPAVTGSIAGLDMESVAAGATRKRRAVLALQNDGLMFFRPRGGIDVLDASGKLVEHLALASFPVLPKRKQRFLLPIQADLPAGPYTLRARIDLGAEVQEASVHVTAATTANQ